MLELLGNSPTLHTTPALAMADSCSGVVTGDGGTRVGFRLSWLWVEHSLTTGLAWIRGALEFLRREVRPLVALHRLDGTVW